MKNLFNRKKYLFILALSTVLLPHSVFASTLYIDTNRSDFSVGDTVLFRVRIDSENQDINTVEGEVLLDYPVGAASLAGISTADSQFSLWPGKPLPSESNTSISFAGGSPGGLNSKDAIIFNIVLKLQKVGQVTLTPNNFSVYLHDGKGTKDAVGVRNVVTDVMPKKPDSQSVDDWNNVTLNDKTPPEPFEITPGQDPSIFDNQYFVSFFAVDKDSGIDYYEIKEGDRDFIRAESAHLLQDQSLKSIVQIKAVDKAGNEAVVVPQISVPPEIPSVKYLIWILVGVAILAIIIAVIRRSRKT